MWSQYGGWTSSVTVIPLLTEHHPVQTEAVWDLCDCDWFGHFSVKLSSETVQLSVPVSLFKTVCLSSTLMYSKRDFKVKKKTSYRWKVILRSDTKNILCIFFCFNHMVWVSLVREEASKWNLSVSSTGLFYPRKTQCSYQNVLISVTLWLYLGYC